MIKQKRVEQENKATASMATVETDFVPLADALASLSTATDMDRFLIDLLTPAERAAFEERWQIAQMLSKGNATYRDIATETGASTTTVTRVARFLFNERHQGYRLILDRLSKQ